MNRINTRSPFIIYKTSTTLSYANVFIRIYSGDAVNDRPTEPTITLSTPALNREIQIEISNEVSSFFESNFSGDYTTDSPWCEVVVETYNSSNVLLNTSVDLYSLFDGYTQFEDGVNYQGDYSLMQSNCDVVTNDLEPINIPVDTSRGDVTVSFYNKGELQFSKVVQQSSLSESTIQNVTNSVGDFDRFSSRVLLDGGVIEAKKCLKEAFDDAYETIDVDSIVVSSNLSFVCSSVSRNSDGLKYSYFIPSKESLVIESLTTQNIVELLSGNSGSFNGQVGGFFEEVLLTFEDGSTELFTGYSLSTDTPPEISINANERIQYSSSISLLESAGTYKEIKVKEIEECRYSPYKVTFKNKFGAWQDLWFFKRSDESISTKSESYKNNLITNGSYNTNRHQYRTFNKIGRKKIKLSSGYYPESYNEVFEEMSLSEYIYITIDGVIRPVALKDGEFAFKKKVNEKLINYTISLDYGFDAINTVR